MIKLIDILNEIKNEATNNGSDFDINNKDGIGAVPHNQDIDYLGFIIEMTPSEYLKLVPPVDVSFKYITSMWEAIKSKGMASPWLSVEWLSEQFDNTNGQLSVGELGAWKITNHEGRHRMHTIRHFVNDNVKIPVHVFPNSFRASELTDEMKSARIIKQIGAR